MEQESHNSHSAGPSACLLLLLLAAAPKVSKLFGNAIEADSAHFQGGQRGQLAVSDEVFVPGREEEGTNGKFSPTLVSPGIKPAL